MDRDVLNLATQGAGQFDSNMQRMTMAGRINQAVIDARERLKDAERAKEILDANPELEELLNIMNKGRL